MLMTPDERDKALALLREPFPPEVIGKLPKGGVLLDFVGHAPTTDRLLSADIEWDWEPLALDEYGLPQYDKQGGLWIKLTVCGVTRLGYGDGMTPKERIGDAIRNAAMRFGVALDLWSKTDLESSLPVGDAAIREDADESGNTATATAAAQVRTSPTGAVPSSPSFMHSGFAGATDTLIPANTGKKATVQQLNKIRKLVRGSDQEVATACADVLDRPVSDLFELTQEDAAVVAAELEGGF